MSGGRLQAGFVDVIRSRPFVVAHRGAPESAPENTLPSFEAAMTAGAQVLECDVRLSRDGEVIVFHDEHLTRTTGVTGLVREWRWRDLERLDAGYGERFGGTFAGTRIPRLQDLLDVVRGRAELMIEIKEDEIGPARDGIERRCMELIANTGTQEIGFISMAPIALRRVRTLAPWCTTGLVLRRHNHRRAIARAIDVGADFLIAHVRTLLARPGLCSGALAAGVALGAYPVNSDADVTRLVASGVTSLASDRPAHVLGLLGSADRHGTTPIP